MALVRVRANGWEFNVGANHAATKGLEVVDAPTHRQDGRTRRAERVDDDLDALNDFLDRVRAGALLPDPIDLDDEDTDSPADAEEEQAEPAADSNNESASDEEQ